MDRRGDEELASQKEFARLAGVSPKTIHRWTVAGHCPKPFKVNGLDRWRLGIIRRWLLAMELEQEKLGVANPDNHGHEGTFPPEPPPTTGKTRK